MQVVLKKESYSDSVNSQIMNAHTFFTDTYFHIDSFTEK